MRVKLNNILSNSFVRGGSWMLLGNNFANFLAYLYHLVFGRLLGPAGYSEFANVISIIALSQSLFVFINIPVVKFATSDNKLIKAQTISLVKSLNKIIITLVFLGLISSPYWYKYLSLSPLLALLIAPNVFLLYLLVVYSAFLQSDFKFKQIVIANIFGWIIRLIFGIIVVYLGFGLFGVFGIYLMASLISLIVLYRFYKNPTVVKPDKEFLRKFVKYSLPSFLMFFSFTSFITADIILVKKYFTSYDAGLYASLSALGKIIFYGTTPVTAALFPIVSSKSYRNEKTSMIFIIGFITTLMISLTVLTIYKIFPKEVIGLMFGEKYLSAGNLLFAFGIFSTIYALNYAYINYFLSKNIMLPTVFTFICSTLQIVGIVFMHSNISQVIYVSIVASIILLSSYIIYTLVRIRQIRFSLGS